MARLENFRIKLKLWVQPQDLFKGILKSASSEPHFLLSNGLDQQVGIIPLFLRFDRACLQLGHTLFQGRCRILKILDSLLSIPGFVLGRLGSSLRLPKPSLCLLQGGGSRFQSLLGLLYLVKRLCPALLAFLQGEYHRHKSIYLSYPTIHPPTIIF